MKSITTRVQRMLVLFWLLVDLRSTSPSHVISSSLVQHRLTGGSTYKNGIEGHHS